MAQRYVSTLEAWAADAECANKGAHRRKITMKKRKETMPAATTTIRRHAKSFRRERVFQVPLEHYFNTGGNALESYGFQVEGGIAATEAEPFQPGVYLFVEGSVEGSVESGRAGWGVVTDSRSRELLGNGSGTVPGRQTIDRAYLYGVAVALDGASKHVGDQTIRVISSRKCVQYCEQIRRARKAGWRKSDGRPIENRDMGERIEYLVSSMKVVFQHTDARSGRWYESRMQARELAREAASKRGDRS